MQRVRIELFLALCVVKGYTIVIYITYTAQHTHTESMTSQVSKTTIEDLYWVGVTLKMMQSHQREGTHHWCDNVG